MNKISRIILSLGLLAFLPCLSFAASEGAPQATPASLPVSLEDQLKALDVGNKAPSIVSKDKLYVIQDRYLPLRHINEVLIGAAENLTGNSFLTTRQVELGYRYHFSDKWSLGAGYAFVSNEFTSSADRILQGAGMLPETVYARTRSEMTAEYNVFYGKFRLSMDQVFYFDQYLALGPGMVELNNGTFGAAVGDIGFAFWLGKWGSARLGLKDYFYNEAYRNGNVPSHNLHAHLDVGYLF